MPYRNHPLYTSNLKSKLDLRPIGGYEKSLESLELLLDEAYETVVDASEEMHPRVSHEVFRYPWLNSEDKVQLESDMVEQVQDTLEDNSEKDYWWLEDKLFNLGYSQMSESPDLRKLKRSPPLNHLSDNVDLHPFPLSTPYRQGKEKRKSDKHYLWANNFLLQDIGNQEIIIE